MTVSELSLYATTQLYWEHRVIEAVTACMRRLGPVATASPEAHADIRFAFEFFATYVDDWHFKNEEDFFVPMLRNMATAGALRAVERIEREHEESRVVFDELRGHYGAAVQAGGASNDVFDAAFARYMDLVLSHLRMEDSYLYHLLQSALSSPAQRHLGWVLRHEPAHEGRHAMPMEQEEAARKLCTRHGVAFPSWDQVLDSFEAETSVADRSA